MCFVLSSPSLRVLLKAPQGVLVKSTCLGFLQKVVSDVRSRVIAVGDVVSIAIAQAWVKIVDGHTQRLINIDYQRFVKEKKVFRVKNPPGMITCNAIRGVKEALQRGGVVLVDGEEDLLALAALLYAEEGDVIVYGQPGLGVVAIKVDDVVKERAWSIIRSMDRVVTEYCSETL